MLRIFSLRSTVTGLIFTTFGLCTYNLGIFSDLSVKSIIAFIPWIFIICSAFIILRGLFYLIQSTRSMSSALGVKVVEKTANKVVLEFEDGSRKKFINKCNTILVQGDIGSIGYKGRYLTVFNRRIRITKRGN